MKNSTSPKTGRAAARRQPANKRATGDLSPPTGSRLHFPSGPVRSDPLIFQQISNNHESLFINPPDPNTPSNPSVPILSPTETQLPAPTRWVNMTRITYLIRFWRPCLLEFLLTRALDILGFSSSLETPWCVSSSPRWLGMSAVLRATPSSSLGGSGSGPPLCPTCGFH